MHKKYTLARLSFLLIVVFFLCYYRGSAQGPNNLAFPSANNTFLGAAGLAHPGPGSTVGVDLYTGTAQLSIPLCNLSGRELSIPISLNYVGGRGIRVQDYPGCAGLGWQLSAGGSISRVVRGFPDEQSMGYLGTGLWGQQVASALQNSTALPSQINSGLSAPTADGEPDIFYVRTPFFSFQFTFDENGHAVFSNNPGITVTPYNFFNTSQYTSSSFVVTDDQGNQYYFGSSSQSVENTTATLFGTSYVFPTTWYMDKIVTFNSKDVITLTYNYFTASDVLQHYVSYTSYDYTGNSNLYNTPVKTTITQPKEVVSIVTSQGEADFTYVADRIDDRGAARLSAMTLKAFNPLTQTNSVTLETLGFNYSYFGNSPPATDTNVIRLRLDNITLAGNTTATATPVTLESFSYNLSTNLPSRQSLSQVDYWGYYTAPVSNPYNVSLPPNQTYAKANILTSVTDITGGTVQIGYELNAYYDSSSGTNIQGGGLRVDTIYRQLPDGENLYTQYQYVYTNGQSTGQILSNSYMGNLWTTTCGVYETLSESPSEYYDLNGIFLGYSQVKVVDPNGGYTISTFSNFSSPNSRDILNYASGGPIPDITSSISFAYKRGLLLDQSVYTAAGNIITEDAVPLASYASLTTPLKKAWAFHWADLSFSVTGSGYQNSCASSASSTYYTNVENFRAKQTIHKDYDQKNPAAYVARVSNFQYSTVNNRLIRSDSSADSKGAFYTKTLYYPDDGSSIPFVTSTELTAVNFLASAAVNRTNVPVHETDSRNGVVRQTHHSYSSLQYGYNTYVYLAHDDQYTGSTLETQEFYQYDPTTWNLVASQMNGGKPTAYLYGYNSSLPVAKAVNAVNTYTGTTNVTTVGADLQVTGNYGQVSFTTAAAGSIVLNIDPFPGYTYSLSYSLSGPTSESGNLCVSRSSTTCSSPATVTFSSMPAGTYILVVNYSSGSSPYMGMSYTYPALQGVTTVTHGFFYEGFEENPYAVTGSAHTGNAYYDGISNGSYYVSFTLPDSRSYIIQWWNWVNGKWVMNQEPYSGPMYVAGIVDDVRVFPSDAQLSTVTYAPLIGMTGQTDLSGRSKTYEFDGLGRLNITRDQDKNILSKDCYSYAGQPVSCPAGTVYSNAVQSGTYTRNNCGTGYQPGTATYTVPAGTYTSSINQADADQQAKNDVNLNGQNYANINGSCTLIYYNVADSQNFTRNNCLPGYTPSTVNYKVPAGTYSSIVSQAAANQLAANDITANGQNYANTNGACTTTQVQKYGDLVLTGTTATVTFTTTVIANIVLSIDASPGTTYALSYSLSGPVNQSGVQCVSRSSVTCSSPSSVTVTNAPTGTYTLTISFASGSSSTKSMSYSYWGAP